MIAAEIVRVSVAVALAVGLIVTVLVTDDIGEREAIMAGNHVDTCKRCSSTRLENICRAMQPLREITGRSVIAAPEATYIVTVLVVPLGPA